MAKKQNNQKSESLASSILQIVIMMAVLLGIYYIVFTFFLSNETVSGPSMQPTFESGDRVIAIRHSTLKRNDIVILKAPDEPGALYIKRIIGMPGDTVESKNDVMYINGKPIKQPYLTQYESKLPNGQLYTNNFSLETLFHVKRVPANSYFVMGDHRDVSKDSRIIGFIKRQAIVGQVKLRYWPLNRIATF